MTSALLISIPFYTMSRITKFCRKIMLRFFFPPEIRIFDLIHKCRSFWGWNWEKLAYVWEFDKFYLYFRDLVGKKTLYFFGQNHTKITRVLSWSRLSDFLALLSLNNYVLGLLAMYLTGISFNIATGLRFSILELHIKHDPDSFINTFFLTFPVGL